MSTTIEELTKASESLKISRDLLKKAINSEPSNIELHKALRDACIQRFEFCTELAWKVSMKILGLTAKAPNPAIRDMAQNNLIDDPQIWFDFLTARNKTSHTYDEEIAKAVYAEAEKLIPELDHLIKKLQKIS
jgi:nucleotidyltransferase substrate binding protein (TIGR01987 family)